MMVLAMTVTWSALLISSLVTQSLSSTNQMSSSQWSTKENSFYEIPDLNTESYIIPGDISIGAVIEATEKPDKQSGKLCVTEINTSGSWILQYMEALAYATHLVNNDSSLLPNITLGLVVLDYCGIPSGSLAQALSFVPRRDYSFSDIESNDDVCIASNASSSYRSNHTSGKPIPHYDVMGVIGPFGSELTLPMSYLYTAVQLPMLSYMATSDELSDTFHHRYFLRVVPPDIFQAGAMLQFISDHGWAYISILYQEGAYGERGFDNLRKMAPSFNICIATAHRMGGMRSDYNYIVNQLVRYSKARVVIIFSLDYEVRQVFKEVQRRQLFGHFIWVGSDGIADRTATFRDFPDVVVGAITFIYNSSPVEEFFSYFANLFVNSTQNPWFKGFWEAEHKCSFSDGTCDATKSIDADKTMKYSHGTSLAIDSIFTFARALDTLIRDLCPHAEKQDLRRCVTGERLRGYLLNTTFDGYTDKIRFDANGDAVGKYQIRQIVFDQLGSNYTTRMTNHSINEYEMVEVLIGMYEATDERVKYSGRHVLWDHLNNDEVPYDQIKTGIDKPPQSICSQPCSIGEYKIEKEVPCCWECQSCRDNEILVEGATRCVVCESFTWPDPDTGLTSCIPIPLTYPAFTDTLPIIQVCLALCAILLTFLVFFAYVVFREKRVIKAASRELSFLQLVAILVGYFTVILCQLKPEPATCGVLYVFFCLSFTWLYAPLLVKTIRIYRIFQCGSSNNKRPKYVSPQSQLIMSGVLIGVQVLICIVIMAIYTPTAIKNQPVWSEKLVELSCDVTLPGLISFLAYNMILVCFCSFFAFKTRKLPDNFNESRFISMCITTTLIIWLAFVATFFTADKSFVRILLLSVTLLLNHTVALLFLFLPKIYAVTCLPKEIAPEPVGHQNPFTFNTMTHQQVNLKPSGSTA